MAGHCSMRDTCGKKGLFGRDLPCPYDGKPVQPDDRDLLTSVCGAEFAQGPTCCTSAQLETLRDNFAQVTGLVSSCPACLNNFKSFFCTFTCSPNQADFLNVTSTQTTDAGRTAVQSVDFFVGDQFSDAFYDSCKSVQMGATNGFAMDFIGGGAKNAKAFLKFLGDEKAIGSPFQIDFPPPSAGSPDEITPLDPKARHCSDNDPESRCSCIDCPTVCPTLEPPPDDGQCNVGQVSCLSFALLLIWGILVLGFGGGVLIGRTVRKRRERRYERVALSVDTASLLSPTRNRGLIGAASLTDGDQRDGDTDDEYGRGASLLDPVETAQPRQHRLNNFLRKVFYRLGFLTASYPWLTFCIMFTVLGLLNIGWKFFSVETDPVRLWVSPTSETKLNKEYFDDKFGPFYRTEQIFITAGADSDKPVLSWDHLKYWFGVESYIRDITSPNGYKLEDVCFKPVGEEGACVVQSVGAWFGNSLDDYDPDTWADHLLDCATFPGDCLPDFQQPLAPQYVLGGVPTDEEDKKLYTQAEAMVVTYVVSHLPGAEEWEEELRAYLVDLSSVIGKEAGLEIGFSTGVSLEEELNKSTNTDVTIVVLSYLAMFLYVSLTLGGGSRSDDDSVWHALWLWARNFPGLFKSNSSNSQRSIDSRMQPHWFPRLPRAMFTDSKVSLALFGIALVILSVSTSVGFFSLLGVKVTLIIAEVIPFLILAVGVDNVFILVHELDRQNSLHGPNAAVIGGGVPTSPAREGGGGHFSPFESTNDGSVDAASVPLFLSAEERVARALAKMGPSILLSSITETVAFALGALVPMPAVRNFALYAAGSVLLNAIMQVTVFVSALCLDLRRSEVSRVDCFPCVRLPPRISLREHTGRSTGSIARFIKRYYAPMLLQPWVKGIVMFIFSGIFVGSVISMQHIEFGLDQRLALPSDSYLAGYFNKLDAYFDVGPPVYFVTKDVDVTQRDGQQALCGRFTTCDTLSLANVLEAERKRPAYSYISEPTASWIDDFLGWLDPAKESCCRVRKNDPTTFCEPGENPRRCRPCYEGRDPPYNITMTGLPEGADFMRYLEQWIVSPTGEECPQAGKASFGTAVAFGDSGVEASHFRTFHKPLKSQADFIASYEAATRIANDISEQTGANVFPYAIHYVFFEQYSHITATTQMVLGLGLAAVLLVTAILLGSWRTGSIVTAVVGLTVTAVMGMMPLWGISLNALSLVNLVISLGIAVEFCAHVARAFMSAGAGLAMDHPAGQKERDERMWTALTDVGPSVLSGITFTKLIGMCVMALTRSKLLEIYYFRMWLTLIVAGALHGLVLLPVILSVAGGQGYPLQEADEEWMANAIRNDYEYAPFMADDDSVTSD
ncbi:multidrug efflux transporter AcrB transmembrane domain-containing protein [Cylindrobasidium torrendii FP15055 ss-10]|uniref:Multidrug efflux transporter AcrB transmembrane domain-containing protein n=1 Tax=Cylindrobasidium torrendii FP15055 ss-10 TaxID=1314674 RepID=A0A0D7B5D1_9AGAR|nr:multidrug efflux transporter AcrB transmembrane domain-containing protein [Cylindrobasidium torrendii FP15055 ss-10]